MRPLVVFLAVIGVAEAQDWRDFDEARRCEEKPLIMMSATSPAMLPLAPPPVTPQRIRVGSAVQQGKPGNLVVSLYPPLTRVGDVQGTVRFIAIVGKDGQAHNLNLISGNPQLVDTAREAIQQWVFKPKLLNGQPIEVVTPIDVKFVVEQP